MSTKTDTIQALTESATKSLGEIVSLKETCKQHEGTIADLNKKKAELTLELSKGQSENAKLSEEITNLNKELNSHENLIKKLEGENKTLSTTIIKLENDKSVKNSQTAEQDEL